VKVPPPKRRKATPHPSQGKRGSSLQAQQLQQAGKATLTVQDEQTKCPRRGKDYAPHTETWWTCRSWLKFYGAYPRGFLAKARGLVLAGQPFDSPILHVCSGRVRDYQTRGFGPNDKCLDLDPNLKPDILADVRDPESYNSQAWAAILADPPYSEEDADHYSPGRAVFPSPYVIVKNAIRVLEPGRRVGIFHLFAPQAPKDSKFVACVTVLTGFNNRVRVFSVYEK
jgi:hypothetical protein